MCAVINQSPTTLQPPSDDDDDDSNPNNNPNRDADGCFVQRPQSGPCHPLPNVALSARRHLQPRDAAPVHPSPPVHRRPGLKSNCSPRPRRHRNVDRRRRPGMRGFRQPLRSRPCSSARRLHSRRAQGQPMATRRAMAAQRQRPAP